MSNSPALTNFFNQVEHYVKVHEPENTTAMQRITLTLTCYAIGEGGGDAFRSFLEEGAYQLDAAYDEIKYALRSLSN